MSAPTTILTDPLILKSPSYRITEQVFNAVTHGLGLILSVVAMGVLLSQDPANTPLSHLIAYGVFGASMCILYFNSMMYHALYFTRVKPVFQFFDHMGIYLLIAGSYTPFGLIAVGGQRGIWLVVAEWILALIGITAKAIGAHWIKRYSTGLYLLMGWLAIGVLPTLLRQLGPVALGWLLFGGLAYSIGTIFYRFDKQVAYFHVIWHGFVLLGSAGIFASIYLIK